jgi:hypothetical protein
MSLRVHNCIPEECCSSDYLKYRISCMRYIFIQLQERHRKKAVSSQDELMRSHSDDSNLESMLKMPLAKGEIMPETYSHLRKLISL